jgi:hypothetical protein
MHEHDVSTVPVQKSGNRHGASSRQLEKQTWTGILHLLAPAGLPGFCLAPMEIGKWNGWIHGPLAFRRTQRWLVAWAAKPGSVGTGDAPSSTPNARRRVVGDVTTLGEGGGGWLWP